MDNGADSYYRFLDGDKNAFVEIIREYKDGLILYIYGFVLNVDVAEELVADTFIKIIVSKPRFRGKSTFKTWLYSIGRNIANDYIRHRKIENSISFEECEDQISDKESLEKICIKEERKIMVHRALSRLQLEYRQVLYLKYFEDFNNSQIAGIMKKNIRQIENLIYRAKQSLKSELMKEGMSYEEL